MDEITAMDETTMVSTDEAIQEIQNHNYDAYESGGAILAYGNGIIDPEVVCEISDGEVSSKTVLEWLGY